MEGDKAGGIGNAGKLCLIASLPVALFLSINRRLK